MTEPPLPSDTASRLLVVGISAVLLTLRRCRRMQNWRDPTTTELFEVGRCERPATYRKRLAPDRSEYLCDVCAVEGNSGFEQVPYADAIRRALALTATAAQMEQTPLAELRGISETILEAIPPCPTHRRGADGICVRCDAVVTLHAPLEELHRLLDLTARSTE